VDERFFLKVSPPLRGGDEGEGDRIVITPTYILPRPFDRLRTGKGEEF